MFSTFSVHYPSITEYKFGRPATDAHHLYETPVMSKVKMPKRYSHSPSHFRGYFKLIFLSSNSSTYHFFSFWKRNSLFYYSRWFELGTLPPCILCVWPKNSVPYKNKNLCMTLFINSILKVLNNLEFSFFDDKGIFSLLLIVSLRWSNYN